ncbi:hypothetical protein [Candidatus Accumulibacter sp. ACC003]|nr:hypothetical protein [Candidatus Accumulibacter sp. ACC003]
MKHLDCQRKKTEADCGRKTRRFVLGRAAAAMVPGWRGKQHAWAI